MAAFLWLAAPCIAAGQPPPSTFSANVELVQVDAFVKTRGDSRPIVGLDCSAFQLEQDGIEQSLSTCQYSTFPIDLVILADVSGSVLESVRKLAQSVDAVLQRSLKPQDRVGVITFASSIKKVQELTESHRTAARELERALNRVSRVDSGTRLYEAIQAAVTMFERPRTKGRTRAVLVLTDDKDGRNKPSEATVITSVLEADVTVFGVVIPSFEPPLASTRTDVHLPIPGVPRTVDRVFRGSKQYRSISKIVIESGGESIMTVSDQDALVSAMDQIRWRYLLAYYPKPNIIAGKPVKLTVRLTDEVLAAHPDALVRHRSQIIK